ncbi:UNVERIFIED_CONTAM: DNA excision repair protein ERCC-1, partial [Sesamum radiatum]
MENRGGPENRQQKDKNEKQMDTSFIIRIPSYEEVVEGSEPKTTQHSLFNPSPSFSQAFNFIKNTEFYTTPPLPSPSTPEVSPSPSQAPSK